MDDSDPTDGATSVAGRPNLRRGHAAKDAVKQQVFFENTPPSSPFILSDFCARERVSGEVLRWTAAATTASPKLTDCRAPTLPFPSSTSSHRPPVEKPHSLTLFARLSFLSSSRPRNDGVDAFHCLTTVDHHLQTWCIPQPLPTAHDADVAEKPRPAPLLFLVILTQWHATLTSPLQ